MGTMNQDRGPVTQVLAQKVMAAWL
ncbi:rCG23194 [Rattus norvegicus]|uniref:RCG23194 n=1 Tax=Rattus norvegicus TaxID=10116 RepID=A6JQ23_RAT|nr:rCG23194 [Rattus norvegicus]